MSRSRIVPAFLSVALAHAVLIGVFAVGNRTAAPRPVESTAIVAQLLSEPSDAPAVAVQSPPAPPVKHIQKEPEQRRESRPPPHVPKPQVAAPVPNPNAIAPAVAPAQASAAPMNMDNAAAPTSKAAANAASPSQSARETIAVAAPKHVDHAECRIVKPAYPELSKRRGETGTATVRFVIGATGAIDSVSLVKSSGFARLDDAAVDALHASTCQPYLENGAPIRVSYTQAFTFGLDDD
ncbi:energy transducer TonB [Trinickia diaoshuihuensis]|uniref:energy transducer TonB n=1 Tax=Trinickia diaoshuihuensis TaxID=2292265 RepID=UPI000E282A32|nr:energy transducer TonB [Trinickia diaoshuihuensis]